jgi:hypothetical protein
MIVGIQGTNSFSDYQVFLRAMGVAMSGMKNEDKELYIYSSGPVKINSMVSEFSNLSERGFKSRGMKIKFFKVPPVWLKENISSFNYFVFLSKPNEPVSKIVAEAELNNVEVGIFRY